MNFLEQLAAEWYAYKGYFIRANIKYGSSPTGGYKGEIDVAAYNARNRTLLHIETSTDANGWGQRKKDFKKKFNLTIDDYKRILNGKVRVLQRQAIVGYSKAKEDINFGNDIEVVTIPEFRKSICEELREKRPADKAVPEVFPLLRAIQFTVHYGYAKQTIK